MHAIIDIGCNLSSPRLMKHLPQVLESARAAGVIAQILTGTDTQSNESSLALANEYHDLYSTIGFHPHHADQWQPHSHRTLHIAAAKEARVVAVGEMGLDYFRHLAGIANQQRCFADQLAIAAQVQKPVFLHERQAFADFRAILSEYLPHISGGVWHCFTGTGEQLEWAVEAGLYIGITGWIADPERGKTLRDIAKYIPADRLMIESDAPYLTPKTLQPTPRLNEPQYLPEVLRVLAECRQEDIGALAAITTANAKTFFRLP